MDQATAKQQARVEMERRIAEQEALERAAQIRSNEALLATADIWRLRDPASGARRR